MHDGLSVLFSVFWIISAVIMLSSLATFSYTFVKQGLFYAGDFSVVSVFNDGTMQINMTLSFTTT